MELEIKFRCDDIAAIKKKAAQLGFTLQKQKHQIDTYFIVNKQVEDGRVYLRIRESDNGFSLDYHKNISELETEETELNVESKEAMQNILTSLGYTVRCVIDKQRDTYKKDNISIMIDSIKGLGDFVELEIIGNITDDTETILTGTAEQLGLKERITKKGYPDMIKR